MAETKIFAFKANQEEQRLIELIKKKTKRRTYSDLVRYLLFQEAEKFLPPNTLERVASKVYAVK